MPFHIDHRPDTFEGFYGNIHKKECPQMESDTTRKYLNQPKEISF
jgi:hypothetical protein